MEYLTRRWRTISKLGATSRMLFDQGDLAQIESQGYTIHTKFVDSEGEIEIVFERPAIFGAFQDLRQTIDSKYESQSNILYSKIKLSEGEKLEQCPYCEGFTIEAPHDNACPYNKLYELMIEASKLWDSII